jgi:hypothetical protein
MKKFGKLIGIISIVTLIACAMAGCELFDDNLTPVTGVSLDRTTLSITVGGTGTLTATVSPSGATDKSVTWSSSAPSVATVSSSGVVTGVAEGSATITVTTADGAKTAPCAVTVSATAVPVTSVALNKTSASLNVGGSETLTAAISPTGATNQNVTWSSSAPSVATVSSSGVVTGVSAGTAAITVTTADGNKTDTCNVTVTASPSAQTLSVTISGKAEVSKLLTANVQNFTGEISYEWYRGTASSPIPYEEEPTYYIQLEDAGKTIKVKVKCGDKTAESSPVSVQDVTYKVEIEQGETYEDGDYFPSDTLYAQLKVGEYPYPPYSPNFTYQWQRNGAAITGATSRSYYLQGADAGKEITVKVTGNEKSATSSKFNVPKLKGTSWEGNYDFVDSEGTTHKGTYLFVFQASYVIIIDDETEPDEDNCDFFYYNYRENGNDFTIWDDDDEFTLTVVNGNTFVMAIDSITTITFTKQP